MSDHTSQVYVEVTLATDNGEKVTFFTEEFTTEELNVRELHKMLEKSETAVVSSLGLRQKNM